MGADVSVVAADGAGAGVAAASAYVFSGDTGLGPTLRLYLGEQICFFHCRHCLAQLHLL
jgi:hypothetical protein